MIAIIAGSGLYEIDGLSVKESRDVDTPFGKPSGPVLECEHKGRRLYFLPRHGSPHSIPPHKVNYRANVWALKDLGVQRIISVSAVGALNDGIKPGVLVLGSQILDFTRNRISTFFDDDVVHVDFTDPFCSDMRKVIDSTAADAGFDIKDRGTYIAVEGPRLETAAEIEFFRSVGADVIGMTAMPEAVLAREAEICYSGIYVVTNYAAGIKEQKLTTDEVVRTMKESGGRIKELLSKVLAPLDKSRSCECRNALRNARL